MAVDGCLTKAPCGGEVSGRNPTDRGKLGIKRSTLVDADGLPLGVVSAPANRHDSPLLAPTLDLLKNLGPLLAPICVHLNAAHDSAISRTLLAQRGLLVSHFHYVTQPSIQATTHSTIQSPTPTPT